jgi:hypothetical protein
LRGFTHWIQSESLNMHSTFWYSLKLLDESWRNTSVCCKDFGHFFTFSSVRLVLGFDARGAASISSLP